MFRLWPSISRPVGSALRRPLASMAMPRTSLYSNILYIPCRPLSATAPCPTRSTLWYGKEITQDPNDSVSPLVSFEELLTVIHDRQKGATGVPALIDVREPDEIQASGAIPTSEAIPVGEVADALQLSADRFHARYGFTKPQPSEPVIFYCRSGVRAGAAVEAAQRAGYRHPRNYKGSWLEYASRTET